MFDSVNSREVIDLYDYGVKNYDLQLIYKANEEIHMAVKKFSRTDRETDNHKFSFTR